MYTRCPDCQTAFRLSAAVLKKAQGRVRCGGCGSTFNALDHLSEELPADEPSSTQTARAFDEQSRELLESLDELAGGDEVRIEDTGVEWRVLDEDDDAAPDAEPPADPGQTSTQWTLIDDPDEVAANAATPDETPRRRAEDAPGPGRAGEDQAELRFDDHTPLPDEFFEPSASFPVEPEDEDSAADEPAPDTGAAAPALELTDADDWEDLLDEVEFDEAAPSIPAEAAATEDADEPALPGDDEETATVAMSAEAEAEIESVADDPEPADSAGERAAQADASDDGIVSASEADHDDVAATGHDGGSGADDTPPATAEPLSEDDEIDRELMQAAAGGGIEVAADPDPTLVETIVMEGDSVTDLLSQAEADIAAEASDDEPEPELESPGLAGSGADAKPAPSRRTRGAMLAASVLLGLLLVAQLVHANRAALATHPLFGDAVSPLYAALGAPVTPAWNIRGWRFESTDGSTDAAGERLTIHSRIVNGADSALPYPLVHVSLTDRFDEVIGSRLLEPDEYLAGNASVSRPVPSGQGFTAVITIDAPAPEATGYKLNVCYPLIGGRVRCAIENFRN